VLGPGGEQVTEYAVSGGASTWVHTNAFSGGHLQATYHDTGTYFYLGDWLGTKRVEVGNMLATNGTPQLCATTYTSLAYGDGLTPETLTGYASCADATEQHFTGKERDAESGNDYFLARYFGSSMGRFLSPDAFYHDSHVADPQSWNEYSYARNNPLRYTDPTGEIATVSQSCTTTNGQTTCNTTITASIAIYKADSSISDKSMDKAASTIEKAIDKAWSGTFKDDNGVTYNVTTQVSVSVQSDQDFAEKSGAQNVVGLTNGPVDSAGHNGLTGPGNMAGQDKGTWNIKTLSSDNTAAHEFTHLLGVDDRYKGSYLSNTYDSQEPSKATRSDFMWGIQESIQNVHSVLNGANPPSTFNDSVTVGAATSLSHWWK
jgi:RHS repeat-associated protein